MNDPLRITREALNKPSMVSQSPPTASCDFRFAHEINQLDVSDLGMPSRCRGNLE